MPDRLAGVAADIYLDAPSLSGAVTVTVTDPAGTAVVNAAAATAVGDAGRWRYALTAAQLTKHGLWTAVWSDGSRSLTRTFTVGGATTAGLSLWALRLQVAARESVVWEGEIGAAESGVIVDHELVGAAQNYRGRWVVLHPDGGTANAGSPRRIRDFSGGVLALARPFPAAPAVGDRYAMFTVAPREIDRALAVALSEISSRARIPLTVSGLTLVTGQVTETLEATIPAGFTGIDMLLTAKGEEYPYDYWTTGPARKLIITTKVGSIAAGDTVQVTGIRRLYLPQYDDSTSELEPTPVVARAAMELMASRAGGGGTDVNEHLRRQMMAEQEWQQSLRHAAGRVPGGLRPVME